jgi:hypothetical protein
LSKVLTAECPKRMKLLFPSLASCLPVRFPFFTVLTYGNAAHSFAMVFSIVWRTFLKNTSKSGLLKLVSKVYCFA